MGKSPVKLRVNLVNYGNDFIEEKEIELNGQGWQKYTVVLMPASNCPHARFRITMIDRGTIDLEHISLFPQKTFNNRPNGLRQDLAQALKDLHPGIFRFPGGCIVEGTNKATRYQWKNTVGPVENRPTNINRWNYTFQNKKFSDYYQSYGLGFYEFFQLSEDIGAEPLPVLNCGLSCQYENDDPNENCAVDKLQPYIDDALDLIEFANGPVSSKWGKLRLDMGHPAPFNLKFVAVGNEQWGKLYTERLEPFVKAIRARYPDIKIVGGAGPQAEGSDFEYLWPEMRRLKIDLVDEHFYRSPDWFLSNAKRYDSYDRQGPKVFAGEYACHPGNRENSFLTALCEAAFMTGFERNADVVNLCTYAPLFAHVDAWQWRPDLIWFDNTSVVKTPNYYVQQLYGMIGFIALAGIMVRNSILIIDFIDLRLKEGIPLKEAIVESGAVRTTPILLTAGGVVIGAIVILFDPIFQGLAISLIGGTITSTVLTLIVVPLLYFKMLKNKIQ